MSEQILQALSAVGTMSLDSFNSSFSELSQFKSSDFDKFNIKFLRYSTIRALSALGHCEAEFDKRYISICPSSLVSLPYAGLPRAVLAGGRTDTIIRKLMDFERNHKDEVSILINRQVLSMDFNQTKDSMSFPLPSVVMSEAVSHDILSRLVSETGIQSYFPSSPAPILTNFSVGINEVRSSLVANIYAKPDGWLVKTFVPYQLTYVKGHVAGASSYLSSYVSQIDQQRMHVYWQGNKGYEVAGDWGRYLILSDLKINVLLYDKRHQLFAVPAKIPLPILLARAATLCSGFVSSHLYLDDRGKADIPIKHRIEVYRAVPLSIAQVIASKLGQHLQFCRIDLKNFGE